MPSRTRRELQDFDNQHDFERLAADVLNSLGYADVEPMAVPGGHDAGVVIRFREGDTARIFATLKATKVNGWITIFGCGRPGMGMLVRGAYA